VLRAGRQYRPRKSTGNSTSRRGARTTRLRQIPSPEFKAWKSKRNKVTPARHGSTIRNVSRPENPLASKREAVASAYLRRRSIHIDFHADRHFDDLWSSTPFCSPCLDRRNSASQHNYSDQSSLVKSFYSAFAATQKIQLMLRHVINKEGSIGFTNCILDPSDVAGG